VKYFRIGYYGTFYGQFTPTTTTRLKVLSATVGDKLRRRHRREFAIKPNTCTLSTLNEIVDGQWCPHDNKNIGPITRCF